MIKSIAFSFAATVLCAGLALAEPINLVAPGTLTGNGLITFDDVAGGASPGTYYDGILALNGASFAERFVGQIITHSGGSDIISGTPDGSLALQVGVPSQNLNVFLYNDTSNVLTGIGPAPVAFPAEKAIGEGAIAVLFQLDQSEFGFDLVGGNVGYAYVSFFRRDGSLVDTITLSGLSNQSYAFSRDGGISDIAGISIYNNDQSGIGFDNLRLDVSASSVPEPSTFLLLVAGLFGAGFLKKRIRK